MSSQMVLDTLVPALPELIGGSADLTGSNNTKAKVAKPVSAENYGGHYIYYGIREHGMAAAMNGMALHGGIIPFGGTFLVFTDYCRPAIRLSALMNQRVVYVMTHDSIGLGEDGPTHQPVEQTATLRMIPNMDVWRPCDTAETLIAWQSGIERTNGPTSLILSRQNLPYIQRDAAQQAAMARGGYVLRDSTTGKLDLIVK